MIATDELWAQWGYILGVIIIAFFFLTSSFFE